MSKARVLILCTGNSCRSQMAEGFLKQFAPEAEVFSAGTRPADKVNPLAVKAMAEKGIDISDHQPELVDKYLKEPFDWVITVCDHAKETCPVFSGTVEHRLHIGYEDPADATGTVEEQLEVYRKVRDQIRKGFQKFYEENLK